MPDEPERRPADEPAPFLTWTTIYIIVAAALALEIAAFAALRWMVR